ncbi:hypothetical protein BASA61_002874 [Batrachochytrium salamandrivorans]|nr:hypothetical protein BASA61_002874 [Batrachochytrium salamandrivorans]
MCKPFAQASLVQVVQTVFSHIPESLCTSKSLLQHMKNLGFSCGEDVKHSNIYSGSGAQGDSFKTMKDPPEPIQSDELLDEMDTELDSQIEPLPCHGSLENSVASNNSDNRVDTPEAFDVIKKLRETTTSVRSSQEIVSARADSNTIGSNTEYDQHTKDAFLVFRTLCKLSIKQLPASESPTDIKSIGMRSKLLSLHMTYMILTTHTHVFFAPAPALFMWKDQELPPTLQTVSFILAVKQYLCLVFTRNIINVMPHVCDITMSIFGSLLLDLRTVLKKEILVMITEVILPYIEVKPTVSSSTYIQRVTICKSLNRTLTTRTSSGRMLVELYLNYDCDVRSGPLENIWERLISALAKIITSPGDVYIPEKLGASITSRGLFDWSKVSMPSLTTVALVSLTRDEVRELYLASGDANEIKLCVLELLVGGIMQPLISWCHDRIAAGALVVEPTSAASASSGLQQSTDSPEEFADEKHKDYSAGWSVAEIGAGYRRGVDSPTTFESQKHRKQAMVEGVKRFNYKPKKGIQFLLDSNCIAARTPWDIARFLLTAEGLNKSMIGEFLGEGDEENIAIMHAFVDEMEFTNHGFVDALRMFLQSFRLPGEAQKIDRFMLKFAERYLKGNPKKFSSADTAYVLAYSVIMLNTDQHNAQVKRRMTKADFLKNNRGIDEGKDLPALLLEQIFDEIQSNEIVMKDEVKPPTHISMDDANIDGRNLYKDKLKIDQAGIKISQKTEALFSSMMRGGDASELSSFGGSSSTQTNQTGHCEGDSIADVVFYSATKFEHVRPMFQLVWMSILMAISTPLQCSDNVEIIKTALQGFNAATHLSCIFDLVLEKRAFLSSLTKFTSFGQLENLRLLGTEDDDDSVASKSSMDLRKDSIRSTTRQSKEDAAAAADISSQTMALSVDRIFTSSARLSGTAILEFVRALCETSWEETKSSVDRTHPRMYCLQRLVEISYYNMNRIRVEWTNIWMILGKHINNVGCHSNSTVAYFALDKLRQLAMTFLELEELPNFKFQKDFLSPFEEILHNSPDVKIKDMILVCLQQMVQAKSKSLKSGWKALFNTLSKASKETHESIVLLSFDIVRSILKNHFDLVIRNHSFGDYVHCLVGFCKNQAFPKICLQSVELLYQTILFVDKKLEAMSPGQLAFPAGGEIGDVVEHAMQVLSVPLALNPEIQVHAEQATLDDNPSIRFWFLYYLVSLNILFGALDEHGGNFTQDFWALTFKGVLFPIFDDLHMTRNDQSKFANREDMSVWLSTTLILALRKLVDLLSNHFDKLIFLFDDVLNILMVCMTQENETLSKIGATCLHQFIEKNAKKFNDASWDRICDRLVYLSESTMPNELFFDVTEDATSPPKRVDSVDTMSPKSTSTRQCITGRQFSKRPVKLEFQYIIVKCVLHLQVIHTLQDLISIDRNFIVYNVLHSKYLLRLADSLFQSYQFAKNFNADTELRTALFRMGFMKQPPNLLKQETLSVSGYLSVLFQMFGDQAPDRLASQDQVESRLIPIAYDILCYYSTLDPDSRKRDINAWRPVVQIVLQGIARFDGRQFERHIWKLYFPIANLVQLELAPESRSAIRTILIHGGAVFGVESRLATAAAQAKKLEAVVKPEDPSPSKGLSEPEPEPEPEPTAKLDTHTETEPVVPLCISIPIRDNSSNDIVKLDQINGVSVSKEKHIGVDT